MPAEYGAIAAACKARAQPSAIWLRQEFSMHTNNTRIHYLRAMKRGQKKRPDGTRVANRAVLYKV